MFLSTEQMNSISYSMNTYLRLHADLSIPNNSVWLQYSFYILGYDEDDGTYMYQDRSTHEWLPISIQEVSEIKKIFFQRLDQQKKKYKNINNS